MAGGPGPGQARIEAAQGGQVVAVGEGKVLDNGNVRAPKVKVGDQVLFGKYAGTEVKLDSEDLLIISETDILGIVKKSKK